MVVNFKFKLASKGLNVAYTITGERAITTKRYTWHK